MPEFVCDTAVKKHDAGRNYVFKLFDIRPEHAGEEGRATTKPRHLLPGLSYSRRQLTIPTEAPASLTLPGLLHVAYSQGAGRDATLNAI